MKDAYKNEIKRFEKDYTNLVNKIENEELSCYFV